MSANKVNEGGKSEPNGKVPLQNNLTMQLEELVLALAAECITYLSTF